MQQEGQQFYVVTREGTVTSSTANSYRYPITQYRHFPTRNEAESWLNTFRNELTVRRNTFWNELLALDPGPGPVLAAEPPPVLTSDSESDTDSDTDDEGLEWVIRAVHNIPHRCPLPGCTGNCLRRN
jgi:hypothetical protein